MQASKQITERSLKRRLAGVIEVKKRPTKSVIDFVFCRKMECYNSQIADYQLVIIKME